MLLAVALSTLIASTNALADDVDWLFTGVVRTTPAGGYLGIDGLLPLSESLKAGMSFSYFYYWAELGTKLQWRYLDGFLVADLQLAAEPGDFIRSSDRSRRVPGLRGMVRGRLEMNLRTDAFWLYTRSTAVGRVRTFEEYDPFIDVVLDNELTVEQAIAPMLHLFSSGDDTKLWLYVEGTVVAEVSRGLIEARPSVGMVYENLLDGFTINLDAYYGLKDGITEGFGLLLFAWWRL